MLNADCKAPRHAWRLCHSSSGEGPGFPLCKPAVTSMVLAHGYARGSPELRQLGRCGSQTPPVGGTLLVRGAGWKPAFQVEPLVVCIARPGRPCPQLRFSAFTERLPRAGCPRRGRTSRSLAQGTSSSGSHSASGRPSHRLTRTSASRAGPQLLLWEVLAGRGSGSKAVKQHPGDCSPGLPEPVGSSEVGPGVTWAGQNRTASRGLLGAAGVPGAAQWLWLGGFSSGRPVSQESWAVGRWGTT